MAAGQTPQLDEIQAAIDAGDIDRARRVVLALDGKEQALLEEELGRDVYRRVRATAAWRAAREARQGARASRDHGHRARLPRAPRATPTASG